MFIVLLIIALAIIFLMEAPRLWKQRLLRDLIVFCALWLISAYFGTAQIFNWTIPNPLKWLLPLFS